MAFLRRRDNVTHATAARARLLTAQAAAKARRARRELLLIMPLLVGVWFAYDNRVELFGADTPVRVATALVLVILGWALARDIGRSAGPWLFQRMDRATAGTVGFLIRLAFLGAAFVVALRVAGLKPETLAVGGAITAVVLGLAAQQTLGNLFAGLVLLSARPFRVGDKVRLQAGGVAGQIEGDVTSLGLLYTTFSHGADLILVPNNVVLSAAIVPLREPAGVDLRARLRPDVKPSEVQRLLEDGVRTEVRSEPHIALEEFDAEEVVVRITATPERAEDGPSLADEILTSIAGVVLQGDTAERVLARVEERPEADDDMWAGLPPRDHGTPEPPAGEDEATRRRRFAREREEAREQREDIRTPSEGTPTADEDAGRDDYRGDTVDRVARTMADRRR